MLNSDQLESKQIPSNSEQPKIAKSQPAPEPLELIPGDSPVVSEELKPVFIGSSYKAEGYRRWAGYGLIVASFVLAVVTVWIILAKMSGLLSIDHKLTKEFLNSQDAAQRSQILIYLATVVGGQSLVTIWLLVWAGKMLRLGTEHLIPLKERRADDSVEMLSEITSRLEPFMDKLAPIIKTFKS